MTIPAVSVLSTRSPKRANIKPLSSIFDLSWSDHPPSGHTQRLIHWTSFHSDKRTVSQRVSRTIGEQSWSMVSQILSGNFSSQCISGIIIPPHCSSASRAIFSNLSIFAGVITSFWDRSERKNTNFTIPISTPFWRIYSIFSYLFGIAWYRCIFFFDSVFGYFCVWPRSWIDFLSIDIIVYSVSEPSQENKIIFSPTCIRKTRVSWWTISESVILMSIWSGNVTKKRCIYLLGNFLVDISRKK